MKDKNFDKEFLKAEEFSFSNNESDKNKASEIILKLEQIIFNFQDRQGVFFSIN